MSSTTPRAHPLPESSRMQNVQAPIIPIIGDLIRSCPGTISLGQGVAYYGPPASAVDRARMALTDPATHEYQAVDGVPLLVEAVQRKLWQENRIPSDDARRVVVTAGANMGFVNAILAITDPGDEVIFPLPYYFNHEMAVTMTSASVVCVPTTPSYQLRPDAIRQAITPRTRAVVTVSPNNPSGVVYPEQALREVNDLCRQAGIYHINDEVYEYFTYDGAQHYSPGALPEGAPHTISLFSFSKAYGFAGWRVGYMVIPNHLVAAVRKVQDTVLVCPPVISQMAALGALESGPAYCRGHLHAIAGVRDAALGLFEDIEDLCTVSPASGAFYLFLKIKTRLTPIALVERLIREHGVAVTPGDAFGMTGACSVRVSYGALQKDTTTEGIGRLVGGLRRIVRG